LKSKIEKINKFYIKVKKNKKPKLIKRIITFPKELQKIRSQNFN
jgi:hypothetical protein